MTLRAGSHLAWATRTKSSSMVVIIWLRMARMKPAVEARTTVAAGKNAGPMMLAGEGPVNPAGTPEMAEPKRVRDTLSGGPGWPENRQSTRATRTKWRYPQQE